MTSAASTRLLFRIFNLLLWLGIVFFSTLLIHNALLYFTHGGEYGILPEKLEAREDWLWNFCFYVHLPSGILCLVLPWVSFTRRWMKGYISLHRHAGKLYLWISAFVVCPTGMYLALYAKGGLITKSGFLIQGILLAFYSLKGYRSIKAGDIPHHVDYMIKSYSVATAVLTFRILHILFFFLQVPYQDNYAISQWLGLTLNLLIAECIVTIRSQSLFSLNKSIL
jgi:hypothetical protein